MKTSLLSLFALFLSLGVNAQTVSSFESLTLSADSYWDGADNSGSFSDGNATFKNEYSGYWAGGFSYSNMKDSTTEGWLNQYSARAAEGFNKSVNYAVGFGTAQINLAGSAKGKIVEGFYVTNTTYAALSMKKGDSFAKKFGGTSGDDADWFMLTVKAWYNGSLLSDSVDFYLADFRASDNSKDYILSTWEWVDLTSLGNVDSLVFSLSSSDVGAWGMNTPAYFAMDNFTTSDLGVTVVEIEDVNLSLFPNPASDFLTLNTGSSQSTAVHIYDASGRIVLSEKMNASSVTFDLSGLTSGVYLISVSGNEFTTTKKFIKE